MTLRDRLLHMVEGAGLEERPAAPGERVRESAFEASPLAQLVIERGGKLALVNLQARIMFGINPRDVGRPFQDLDVSYRPIDLRTPIDLVTRDREATSLRELEWPNDNGETRYYHVQLVPLGIDPDGPTGVSVTFTDVTRYRQLHSAVEEVHRELETAYEELQSTAEELETTNEELQSMNEELQSTNEELRQRTDDLNRVNLFLDSILASLEAGVVVVDRQLRVQAWNDRAAELWGVRAGEVQDRHFPSLDIGLPVDELAKPLREVLADDAPKLLTLDAVNRRGRKIECDVNVRPLRSPTGETDGLILLMSARDGSTPDAR